QAAITISPTNQVLCKEKSQKENKISLGWLFLVVGNLDGQIVYFQLLEYGGLEEQPLFGLRFLGMSHPPSRLQ
ncbi:MAG: hypothetical protein ACXABY_10855, partial [Candidatus Thorarchaeota archaeon]